MVGVGSYFIIPSTYPPTSFNLTTQTPLQIPRSLKIKVSQAGENMAEKGRGWHCQEGREGGESWEAFEGLSSPAPQLRESSSGTHSPTAALWPAPQLCLSHLEITATRKHGLNSPLRFPPGFGKRLTSVSFRFSICKMVTSHTFLIGKWRLQLLIQMLPNTSQYQLDAGSPLGTILEEEKGASGCFGHDICPDHSSHRRYLATSECSSAQSLR